MFSNCTPRTTRGFLASVLALTLSVASPSRSRAAESPVPEDDTAVAPAPAPKASTAFKPQPVLLGLGIGLSAVGYGGVMLPALPSTVGLALRVFYFAGTGGIGWVASCWARSTTTDDGTGHLRENVPPDNYVCSGNHGAVQLLVPFAGPLLFAKNHPRDSLLNPNGERLGPTTTTLLYVGAGAEIAGTALLLLSLAAGETSVAPSAGSARSKMHMAVLPQVSPTGAGVGFTIQNW